jgi:O-antigen/teichoic acid export membrane protein
LSVTLTKQMISRIYAMRHFEECRIRWFWDKKKFIEMFSYAGWSFLGKTSGTFAGQGVNMVVNVVFGPAVNAARSLSWTVIHAVQIFVNNFTLAINPQVTQSYASGEYGYMKQLLFRGSKFSFFIMWMIVLPLILETEFVVGLWLGDYPDHTINFIRLALLYNQISTLHIVLAMGIRATGKIQRMQISFSLLEFFTFFASYYLLHHGFPPEASYFCSVFVCILQVFVMWRLSKMQLSIPTFDFIRSVVIPSSNVTIVSCLIPICLRFIMPLGWFRFVSVLFASLASSAISILFLGCDSAERKMIIEMVLGKIRKIYG